MRLLFSDCFHDHKPSLSLLDNGFSSSYVVLSHLDWHVIHLFLEAPDRCYVFSVILRVPLESLVIFDVRNNMLSACALFEKGVKLFKIVCFVSAERIVT